MFNSTFIFALVCDIVPRHLQSVDFCFLSIGGGIIPLIQCIDSWPRHSRWVNGIPNFSFLFLDSGVLGRIPRFCALRWPWLVSWFGERGGQDHKMWMELCLNVYPEIVAEIVLEIIMREKGGELHICLVHRALLFMSTKTVDLPRRSTHVGVVCIY